MKRRFNRFELKFVIDDAVAKALTEDLAVNMTLDPYGADGVYRVTSLYYDSPDFVCFRSKVEGIKYRRKVRVRTYGHAAASMDSKVALEIKQRINRTVQKRRVRTSLRAATDLIERHELPEGDDAEDREVLSEVLYLARMLHLEPACVISYLREAWIGGTYEPGLRITFDRALSVRGPDHGLLEGMRDQLFAPPDRVILEVKADEAVPLWVTRMLTRHGCQLTRVSKYCAGLARLQEAS
ncbi:MAG: polyphosphate polymerase domain-containing protein [Deltaproteobacteria bacterium]